MNIEDKKVKFVPTRISVYNRERIDKFKSYPKDSTDRTLTEILDAIEEIQRENQELEDIEE